MPSHKISEKERLKSNVKAQEILMRSFSKASVTNKSEAHKPDNDIHEPEGEIDYTNIKNPKK